MVKTQKIGTIPAPAVLSPFFMTTISYKMVK